MLDALVKSCPGGVTAKRLAGLVGMSKAKVNAILHADRHFVKTERSPLSHVNARVVWTWSETPVNLPKSRVHINSRNKHAKKMARAEFLGRVHATTTNKNTPSI
jgi:hypothetical protein